MHTDGARGNVGTVPVSTIVTTTSGAGTTGSSAAVSNPAVQAFRSDAHNQALQMYASDGGLSATVQPPLATSPVTRPMAAPTGYAPAVGTSTMPDAMCAWLELRRRWSSLRHLKWDFACCNYFLWRSVDQRFECGAGSRDGIAPSRRLPSAVPVCYGGNYGVECCYWNDASGSQPTQSPYQVGGPSGGCGL
jgi:hypothetical protein